VTTDATCRWLPRTCGQAAAKGYHRGKKLAKRGGGTTWDAMGRGFRRQDARGHFFRKRTAAFYVKQPRACGQGKPIQRNLQALAAWVAGGESLRRWDISPQCGW